MKKNQHVLFIVTLLTIAQTNTTLAQTWNGSVSTAWGTAGNWSGGVPTGTNAVTIPNTTNKPVFSTGTYTQSNNSITINSGASLTIAGGTFATSGGNISGFEEGTIIVVLAGGALNISGGTLNNNGAIRNSGTITYTSGTYSNGTNGYYYSQSTTGASLFTGTTYTNRGVVGDLAYVTHKECSYFGSGLTSSGKIAFNLSASNTPCTGFNQVVVTGTANLSGANYEAWDVNSNVASNTTYTLLTATSITGFTNADISLQNATGTKYVHLRKSGNTITGLVNTSPTLPIELLNFDANTEGGKNHLTWATGSEVNSKGFDIERSQNGTDYYAIGNVKAQGKAATYTFTDAHPLNGTNYYRLKSIDNDGSFDYSKTIAVETGKGKKTIKVFPNTTEGVISIENETLSNSNVSVFNSMGQLVYVNKSTNSIDLSGMVTGIYFVEVQTGNGKVVEKVFKR